MTYVLKLICASAMALVVTGLAINYTMPIVAHWGDIVLFTYLGVICVALPGLTWFGTAKLLKVL